MRRAEHVEGTKQLRNAYKTSVVKLEGKTAIGDIDTDGRIILKLTLKKYDMKVWTAFRWLRIGSSGGILCTW
jgi:hypothetical protein